MSRDDSPELLRAKAGAYRDADTHSLLAAGFFFAPGGLHLAVGLPFVERALRPVHAVVLHVGGRSCSSACRTQNALHGWYMYTSRMNWIGTPVPYREDGPAKVLGKSMGDVGFTLFCVDAGKTTKPTINER